MHKNIFILLCVFSGVVTAQNTEARLESNWKFRQTGQNNWYHASVPGCVHTDLAANKLIPEPFAGGNEQELRWIENEDWEYKTIFLCEKKTLANRHVELVFEGLDTYAKVYLNDSLILTADNMFRSWTVDVKKILKEGNNTLSLLFESAVKRGKNLSSALPYSLPEGERVFTRKAQFHYGWDFAPRFVSAGIWKEIKIKTWNDLKITSFRYQFKKLHDSIAHMIFQLATECDSSGTYDLYFSQQDVKAPGKKISLSFAKGRNRHTIEHRIKNPKLWWCNGAGKPNLYTFSLDIKKGAAPVEVKKLTTGLRQIKLVADQRKADHPFYFELNGKRIFMKGANLVPPDIFVARIHKEEDAQIIRSAQKTGMNMMRVWGGGIYMSDDFYRSCDEKGILVWQDLMFAGSMYPGDDAFLSNVTEEVKQQAARISTHPCLALWCGNNEIDEGWHNWGWQKKFKYSPADSAKIGQDYQKLFHEIIPAVLKEYSPEISYWPSSPSIGWGRKESMNTGDSHYWGVWWGNEPFENYISKTGRFVSEYGFQALPCMNTLGQVCDTSQLTLNSVCVKNHQKNAKGFETIKSYMQKDFKVPAKFDEFVYVSQLRQLRAITFAAEAHRKNKSRCMGTLFWQLNDCWPSVSWSAVDYYKIPKASGYELKRLYDNYLVCIGNNGNGHGVMIVSDSLKDVNGKLKTELKDFSGKSLLVRDTLLRIKADSAQWIFSLPTRNLQGFDSSSVYLTAMLTVGGRTIKSIHYFTRPQNLKLSAADIKWNIDPKTNSLSISANHLVKNLYISFNGGAVVLPDNFFDLEAGESRKIKLPEGAGKLEPRFYSLNNIK